MNPNKFLVTITDDFQIELYKKARITNFLFPLKDFCVGIEKTFSLSEIEEGYIFINRILDHQAYQSLKEILKRIPNTIKGIVFEDFGVITLAKELNLSQQLILCQTHFATNYQSINENLEFVDSIVIGTDITKEEIETILKHANKPLCYLLYGLIPGMYSRRTLLTNFEKYFQTRKKSVLPLEEKISKEKFLAVENEYGTVLYHDKYFNGQNSVKDDNILFYLIHPLFLETEEIVKLLNDLINNTQRENKAEDDGFLNTKTIYRLKGE